MNAAVEAAGKAKASVSLTLIRSGKEITVAVTPEQRKATAFNDVRGFPDGWNLDLPEDDMFQFHQGMEQRMRRQMEQMRNRMRLFEDRIRNGM